MVFTHPFADQFSELNSDQKPPPKPPLKRPEPVKSSVSSPEKATEYTKHDSSSPALGVNFAWILFEENGFQKLLRMFSYQFTGRNVKRVWPFNVPRHPLRGFHVLFSLYLSAGLCVVWGYVSAEYRCREKHSI